MNFQAGTYRDRGARPSCNKLQGRLRKASKKMILLRVQEPVRSRCRRKYSQSEILGQTGSNGDLSSAKIC